MDRLLAVICKRTSRSKRNTCARPSLVELEQVGKNRSSIKGCDRGHERRRLWHSEKKSLQLRIILLVGFLLVSAPADAGSDHFGKGRQLYVQHCAACHGIKADGHGPLEHELSTPPTDLRHLSERYGNPLLKTR